MTGTFTGAVSDGVAGGALAGVTVTVSDLGGGVLATALTGADGKFSVSISAGPADLTFVKTYYTSSTIHSGVGIGQTVNLTVNLSESASGKPSVSMAGVGNDVGFGAVVALTASGTDPNGDTLTYTWANTTAPPLGTVTGTGVTGSITMPTMTQAFAYRPDATNPGQFISGYQLEDRFGIIPILPDTRGQVTATVTVRDGRGQSSTASLTVSAASVAESVRNVAVGSRIYLNSGHDTTNAWTLAAPSGSTAALSDVAARIPWFVADKTGAYTVGEGANSLVINVGDWKGAITGGSGADVTPDSNCTICHNDTIAADKFTAWKQTGHATLFMRGINGVASSFYSGSCVSCHTVGHDDGVANNGFDDVAKSLGWTFPAPLSSNNWNDMAAAVPELARLAGIQCENCHGPNDSAAHMQTEVSGTNQPFVSPRISYKAEACATCHAAGAHHIYSEWATTSDDGMGHSSRAGATHGAGATGLSSSCGRCHTAQGYTLYADLLQQGKVALNSVPAATLAQVTTANVEPVTCVACHDPHDVSNPNQLRFYGDTPNLPSGFAGVGMGKGALCLTCHNSRNGAQTGSDALTYLHEDGEVYNGGNPTGYSAPHQACQGDVFTGHNAYFLGNDSPMTSKHAAIEDTCVGCHMTLQPRGYLSHGAPARSGHLFGIEEGPDLQTLCSNCHGATVNGEGIQAQVEAQLASLASKMGTAAKAKLNGFAGGLVRVRAWDSATDYYSSTSASNVVLDVVANPITSVGIEEIHGQIGLVLTFQNAITVPFVTGSGAPAPSKDLTTFGVQLGAVKDNASTPAAIYALGGNLVRAGWNYFLVEGDNSKGLHNPSFVLSVLNNTLKKDLSN